MDKLQALGCLCSLACLSGCANTLGNAAVHKVGSITALTQPASVRSAYINGNMVCAEPPPDAALQAVAKAAASLTTQAGTKGEASGELTTSVVALAGRTQTVLIARDAFTANCLLLMNNKISTDKYSEDFGAVLQVVALIAKADKVSAEADAARAQTEQAKVGMASAALYDPAIKKRIDTFIERANSNVETIITALSKDGNLNPAWVSDFFSKKKS